MFNFFTRINFLSIAITVAALLETADYSEDFNVYM